MKSSSSQGREIQSVKEEVRLQPNVTEASADLTGPLVPGWLLCFKLPPQADADEGFLAKGKIPRTRQLPHVRTMPRKESSSDPPVPKALDSKRSECHRAEDRSSRAG